MSLKQTIGKRAKARYYLGKDLQGIKRAVSMTPKHDRHGLGYQSSNHGRNGQARRQKENGMASSNLIIPLLHQTFRSRGYINSSLSVEGEDVVASFLTFTINAIAKNEEMIESACLTVYPCPTDFKLSNWSTMESLLYTSYQSNVKLLYPRPRVLEDLLYMGLSF